MNLGGHRVDGVEGRRPDLTDPAIGEELAVDRQRAGILEAAADRGEDGRVLGHRLAGRHAAADHEGDARVGKVRQAPHVARVDGGADDEVPDARAADPDRRRQQRERLVVGRDEGLHGAGRVGGDRQRLPRPRRRRAARGCDHRTVLVGDADDIGVQQLLDAAQLRLERGEPPVAAGNPPAAAELLESVGERLALGQHRRLHGGVALLFGLSHRDQAVAGLELLADALGDGLAGLVAEERDDRAEDEDDGRERRDQHAHEKARRPPRLVARGNHCGGGDGHRRAGPGQLGHLARRGRGADVRTTAIGSSTRGLEAHAAHEDHAAGQARRGCTWSRSPAWFWYSQRAMSPEDATLRPPTITGDALVAAIPVVRVASAERSVQFYCGRLGFTQDWWHQATPGDPATVSVSRGGAAVILTERGDLGRESQLILWTTEIATLFGEWGHLDDVVLEHGPAAMPWGLTEMALRDPDGNRIRVAQPTGCQT